MHIILEVVMGKGFAIGGIPNVAIHVVLWSIANEVGLGTIEYPSIYHNFDIQIVHWHCCH
jgi:hypothetical protein